MTPPSAESASQLPLQRIKIAFELDKHALTGTSMIQIPAHTTTAISLGDLTILGMTFTGPGYSINENTSVLSIPQDSSEQLAIITFEKQFPPANHHASGIITAQGITLLGFWYPVIDGKAQIELTATIPANFSAISEAEEILSVDTPQGKEVSFQFPEPLDNIHFIAGPYIVEKTDFGNGKKLYTYFFAEDQSLAEGYRNNTLGYLGRYEKLIGEFPYKRFSVVENRLPTGFAMPTFTLLGQSVVRLPFITKTSLGHEVLHSWFGNSIDIDMNQGNWAEGLTTYLADHLYAKDHGEDIHFRKNQIIKYMSYVNETNAIPLSAFTSANHLSPQQRSAAAVGYGKSSMLFHMLITILGEEDFIAALNDFYYRMNGKNAGWSDLITSFEQLTGSDLEFFFTQWLGRSDIPRLGVKNLKTVETSGRPILSFTLIQETSEPYSLDVPLAIATMGGKVVKQTISVTETETLVEIPLFYTPLELIIDQDYDLIRELNNDELPPVWSRFIGDTHKLAVTAGPIEEIDAYTPLLKLFDFEDAHIIPAAEVTDELLAGHSVLFLGAALPPARALFALPDHPEQGFTLDIRSNPFNPDLIAILAYSSSTEETKAAVSKLRHYGKYGYLHFEKGRLRDKKIPPSASGMRYVLRDSPPGIATQQNLTFDHIIEHLADKWVVYIGENHTRYEDHQMQLDIIRALYARDPNLAIGMEMFSRQDQQALDDYIDHHIDEKSFLLQSNYFKKWGYDYRLYREIINFARLHRIPVIALNLDKDIVSKVYREEGASGLQSEELQAIPTDRDLDLPGYRERLLHYYAMHNRSAPDSDRFKNFLQSQALWDETMAETIADYLAFNPQSRMVVLAGQGHVVKSNAIPPRVIRRLPLEQAVVANGASSDIDPAYTDYLLYPTPAKLPPAPLLGVMLKEDEKGVQIIKVSEKSGAHKAKIKEGDTILAIDGVPVENIATLKVEMFFKNPGDTIKVLIRRAGKFIFPDTDREIDVTL
ncbi:ChaN family lipoprotein [Thermodesulfobacteriota bacterium]